MATITAGIRRALALMMALVALFGSRFGGEASASGAARLVQDRAYALNDGVCFGQGLACDGTYFYGFGAIKVLNFNAITKIDAATGAVVAVHEMCLPADLMAKGYAHLGDGCLVDGKLYIALEDFGFRNPGVAVYDAETLAFLDFHLVPAACRGNGRIPWCAIRDGVLYFTQSNDVDELRMLRVEDFSFLGTIPLDQTLYKVQGGEFLNGKLYLVTNSEKYEKPVFEIDPATGHVETYFTRNVGKLDMEGEGIAICPLADGSLFHVLDVGPSVHLRSYALQMNDQ